MKDKKVTVIPTNVLQICYTVGMKICSKCNQSKSEDSFYKDKRKRDGLYSSCKTCFLSMAHRPDVQDHLKKYRDSYYSKNKALFIARVDRWRKDNPEKWKKTRRLYEKSLRFKMSPKYVYLVIKQNSKRRGMNLPMSQMNFLEWYSREPKFCFYCGVSEDRHTEVLGKRLEIDRIVNNNPYQIGNIVLCCRYCNSTKGSFLSKEDMLFIGKNVIKNKWLKL